MSIAGIGVTKTGDAHAFMATPIGSTTRKAKGGVPALQEVKKRVVLSDAVGKQLQQHLRFGQIGRHIGPR